MVNVPAVRRYNTGDDGHSEAYAAIDRFFVEVRDEVGDREDGPSLFEIKRWPILAQPGCPETEFGTLHALLYDEKRVVACVTETPDRMNWICYTYFCDLRGLPEE